MGKARLGPKSTKVIEEPKKSDKPSKAPVQQAILPMSFSEQKESEIITLEKIVYIDKPVETIKEVFIDVIKEVFVPFEVIKIEEKIVEIFKEVPVEVEKIVEIFVPQKKFIDKEILINKVPTWMLGLVIVETLTIIGLIIKLI